jgi:rhodanese-related sulfurtransferase
VNFLVDNWQIILVALMSGGMLLWPTLKNQSGGLTAPDAVQQINRAKAILIDVSDATEYAALHAKGSKNIPLKDLESKLAAACKNKALPLIFVCPQGKRSASAISIAKKMGYEQVNALAGGLRAWQTANLPVERATA